MSDDKQLRPDLQALEARLAAAPPKIESWEKDEILYACAFAAGQRIASRSLRVWQSSAAVLGVCFFGALVPLGLNQSPNIERIAKTIAAPRRVTLPQSPEVQTSSVAPSRVIPKLDAWRIPVSEGDLLEGQLAQLDPVLRSSTVSALTQSVLKSESRTH